MSVPLLRYGLFALAGALGAAAAPASAETIKIGVTTGPHRQIIEEVKKVAAADGLELSIVQSNSYEVLNADLAAGTLDANSCEPASLLEQQDKERGYRLVPVAKTVAFPMALYSKKVKSLAELPAGARVAIPDDPASRARALLLLQSAGVLKLAPEAGAAASLADVRENPRQLKLVEVEGATVAHTLDDFDAATVDIMHAAMARLRPEENAIAFEPADSPYVHVVAVQAKDKDAPWVAKLVKAYRSPEVKSYIERRYGKHVLTSW
jgi:D-methionine transport system substrate-binding protein